jgi:hypothetical protein
MAQENNVVCRIAEEYRVPATHSPKAGTAADTKQHEESYASRFRSHRFD